MPLVLSNAQIAAQRAAEKRNMPDTCTVQAEQSAGVFVPHYVPEYPTGVPCRLRALPPRETVTQGAGDPVVTTWYRWNVVLPGDASLPRGTIRVVVGDQTLESTDTIPIDSRTVAYVFEAKEV